MKKKIIIVGITLVLLIVGFSGCTETQQEGNLQNKDSDGDGYGDNSDDFPNDSNLHEKIVINYNDMKWQLSVGEWEHVNFWIGNAVTPKEAKYVYVKMESSSDIQFYVECPTGTLLDKVTSNVDTQYYLTEDMKDEWRVWGRNDGEVTSSVDIRVETWV